MQNQPTVAPEAATPNPSPNGTPVALRIVPGKLDQTLPIGIWSPDGHAVRTFEPREHTAEDLPRLQDRKLRARDPLGYMLRVLALGLESLGSTPIYAQYKGAEFKEPPDILNQLPIPDVEYLMLFCQVHNYGAEVEVQSTCQTCGASFKGSFDLNKLELTKLAEEEYAEAHAPTVTVQLSKGAVFNLERYPELSAIRWDRYVMKVPTVQHLKQADQGVTSRERLDAEFDPRLLTVLVEDIRSAEGQSLPKQVRGVLGTNVITQLSARDARTLNRYVDRHLPRLDREIVVVCRQCGQEGRDGLGPTTLLPFG